MDTFSAAQIVTLCAILGALLCSVVAVVMKPLNLGLFENIAIGALSGGLVAYLLRQFPIEPLALMLSIKLIGTLGPMVALGLWLNARAR